MSVPGSMRPDTTLSKDAKTDDVRLWLGETSVGKKRPSASAVDAAVGSLQKVSISFQGGDGTGKTGAASRRGSLDRSAGAHHPNGDDVDKEDNTDVTDDEDEAGLCTDQRELARLALYWILGKTDLILGVVLLGVAMWVRATMLLSDDPRKKKTVGDEENAWRWMLFVACILLGRFLARWLVNTTIYALDRLARDASTDGTDASPASTDQQRRLEHHRAHGGQATTLKSVVYYLHVLRAPLKRLLLMIGITVSWATLVRPVLSGGVHETTTKAFATACLVLFAALIHSLGVKNLTSRLHSSTFWEQLHTTVRQENILKKLAGPPIRPRPRPAKGQGKAWKLVRGALRQRRRDQERLKKKDGSDNLTTHERGGGVAGGVALGNGGMRRGASEGSLAALAQRATHRRDRSLDSDGGGSDYSPFDTVRSDVSCDNPHGVNGSHSRPSLMHVQFTDGAEATTAGGGGVDLAPVAEGSDADAERNGRNARNGHHNHDQSSNASSDNEREGSMSDGSNVSAWNEPSGAEAAKALGSAEVGTLGAGDVPIAMVNAAARHVKKGLFSLPFRKTTRAMQKLRPKRMDSAGKPGSPGYEPRATPAMPLSQGVPSVSHPGGGQGDTETERAADAAAAMMFNHLRRPGQPFVTPEAVADFVEGDKVEEAFALVGGADCGVRALSEGNVASAMRKIYAEREALGKTLSDTSDLVNNVGVMIGAVLAVVVLFVSLGIFNVDVAGIWVLVSSAVLATAFVFGTTAATMFRALLMIFYTNPFGVGDWIRVDGEILQVRELGLSFFVVVNFWGEVIFLPVSTVLDARIFNLSRSPPLWMNTTFNVDMGVTQADIDHVQNAMAAHIDSDPANYTHGSFTVYCREMRDPLKCHITCFYQLAFNASEFEKKLRANNRFLVALQAALMELPSGVSFAGTDGQIFKCVEHTSTRAKAGGQKSAPGGKGGVGRAGLGSTRGSPRVSLGSSSFGTEQPSASRETPATDQSAPSSDYPAPHSAPHSAPQSAPQSLNRDGAYASGYAPPTTTRRFGSTTSRARVTRRAPFRIPGRLRHYTGMLGDMNEVVTFDAYDGQVPPDSDED